MEQRNVRCYPAWSIGSTKSSTIVRKIRTNPRDCERKNAEVHISQTGTTLSLCLWSSLSTYSNLEDTV
jgi:hypothetical protein